MTVYEWKETEHFFLARVRPEELFDLSTLWELPSLESWNDPDIDHGPVGPLKALHLDGHYGTLYFFIDKRAGREEAERRIFRASELYVKSDAIALGKHKKSLGNIPEA